MYVCSSLVAKLLLRHIADQLQARRLVCEHDSVPHIAVPQFFGRQQLIKELQNFLLEPQEEYSKPKVAVLQSLGGQGKSQIALEICRRMKKECRGVFWLDATSQTSLERGFEGLAERLDQPTAEPLNIVLKIKFVLNTIQEWKERWLIVYDGYDWPKASTKKSGQPEGYDIKMFMPNSKSICEVDVYVLKDVDGNGGVLCTSRHEATKVLGRYIQVPSMLNDGGVELLLRDFSAEDVAYHRSDGEEIVRRLGGLALAIEQAAACISYNRMVLHNFIDEYERKKRKVLEYMREELWEYQKRGDEAEESEALSALTTWEMPLEQIERGDTERKNYITRFLSVAAFLEPSHIGSYLFETYLAKADDPFLWVDIFQRPGSASDEEADSDTDQESHAGTHKRTSWSFDCFWAVAERLCRLSLVQSAEKTPLAWISLHPVIRDWLQVRQKKRLNQGNLRDAIRLVSVVARSLFATEKHWLRAQELLAHLDSCVANARYMKLPKALGCMAMRDETGSFGAFYESQGRYSEVEKLFWALWQEEKTKLEISDSNLLHTMIKLASTYKKQGLWRRAEELEVQVTETRMNVLGKENYCTLTSMSSLASTYQKQGRWKEAKDLIVQVMETLKRVFGDEHPGTLISISSLASMYADQKRSKEAEELGVQVIETRKRVFGDEHLDTLNSRDNLALIYCRQGRWKEAEELYVQVIGIKKRVLGDEHPNTLISIDNLASTYGDQGRWKEAEELGAQVTEMFKRVLGDEHPDTLISINNLASTYAGQERWKEVGELGVQVMETRKRVFGDGHLDTLNSMENLAFMYGARDVGRKPKT